MDILKGLNDKQREAAMCTEGPVLILAGAGSGKTATITRRIAYLVEEKGVRPWNILAVTFTNKAAGEMRQRVEDLIGEDNITGMWIMTFHAACLRILRRESEVLGYESSFSVYDPTDQKTVMKKIAKDLDLSDKLFKPQYILSIISNCKNRMVDAEGYLAENGSDFRTQKIYKAFKAYEKTLKKNNAMDFDDLLVNTVKLFEADEAVLMKYQERFRYIMVDEYQDTNYVQYKLVKLLSEASRNICVVGDDDQCIYRWRGADITNILDFENDFKGAKVVKLEQNYRSTPNILDAAYSVIRNNRERKDKKLWTGAPRGDNAVYQRLDSEKDEAGYVAGEVDMLHRMGRSYSDFAVLYRMNAQSRTFEEALAARGIPYRMLGGVRYYDRKEIKDMMCYMRLVQSYSDDVALTRVINEPKRGVGAKTLDKLAALAAVENKSIFQTLLDPMVVAGLSGKASKQVGEMVEVITQLHDEAQASNLRVSDIYDTLLARTGYFKALEVQDSVEAESRMENLLEFKSVILDHEKENPELTLSQFMEEVALMAEVDNYDPDEDAVTLMTMHSAKGLEFPVVFMPGMEDGVFPGWRSLDSQEGMEEERRLCYVGMTRAKEKLFLTSAAVRTLYGRTDYTRESAFLRELDPKLVDGDAVYRRNTGQNRFGGSLDGSTGVGESSGGRFGGSGSGFGSGSGSRGSGGSGSGFGGSGRGRVTKGNIYDQGASGSGARGSSGAGSVSGSYGAGARGTGGSGASGGSRYGGSGAPGSGRYGAPGGKPFNSFQSAKRGIDKLANSSAANLNLSSGDRVSHAKFGEGTVKEVKGKIVVIAFDSGDTKKLALAVAPLKKL